MIGNSKWIPERDVNLIQPIRFKILIEILPEKKPSAIIHAPDTLKKGDTTRKSFWARIVKVGNMVNGTVPDMIVAMDPSLDIMSPMRCFRCESKHYMLCDVSDIIMVMENENATADNCEKEICPTAKA